MSYLSCTIGVKEKDIIIYASFVKHQVDGPIRIATNKPIPVTLGNIQTTMDLGGYYVIHERDLQGFLEELKKCQIQK